MSDITLYNVDPNHAQKLAGRVVGLLRKAGLRDRSVLNRIHDITFRHANEPENLKLFLRNVVDVYTAPAPLQQAAPEAVPEYDDRNDVKSGEVITDLTAYEITPDVIGETFRVPIVDVDDGDRRMEE